jgi:hypothetical protein
MDYTVSKIGTAVITTTTMPDSCLIGQWSVPIWYGDILMVGSSIVWHRECKCATVMHVLKLHQCATEPLNSMILLLHMKFLDQVVTSSFLRTTLLPSYYYYYYYHHHHHHHARFSTRAADRYAVKCALM